MRIFPKLFKCFIHIFLITSFSSAVYANFSFTNSLTAGTPPEAVDVRNFLLQNIAGRSQLLPLIGKDADGTIVSFKVLTLPNSAAGILYLSGVAVTVNQVLTPAQAKQLQFEVKTTFTGTASFTYTVTDNEALFDASPATFSIPVTNDGTLLVCNGGGLGANILGAQGTFSAPFITPNPSLSCINDNSNAVSPLGNLGNAQPTLTNYTYASTPGSLGPEGTYSFLKSLGTMATRNCIKTDWVAADHTGDGGYAMIVNGSPNAATFGKTFYQASTITVCPNTLYEFSAYVINILPGNHTAATAGTEPNISFFINGQLVSTSGAIAYAGAADNYTPKWVKVGGLWYSGPNTSVNLRIDNATFVAGGNDLGLDDISLAICGPDITYPNISLTPQFCSYGVLPLKANIKASINTYSAYIFQNSTDGGLTWTDMGAPKIGSPTYNSGIDAYEYIADYGDIPIDPSMNGYRYRLKVATEISNLPGTSCNISADKIITVSAFTKPVAGTDIVGCNSSTTAKVSSAGAGETWSAVAGNPAVASIDQSGNISGMLTNGIYKFQITNTSGCADTLSITRDEVKSAGTDAFICSPSNTYKLADAGTGYKWEVVPGNPASAIIDVATGEITGMTSDGVYHFILRSDFGGCTDEVLVTRTKLVTSFSKTDLLCFGTSTGLIDLTVSGGTAPYSFAWDSGQTTEDLTGIAAGTYIVTVTDDKGCTATETVTITQPAAALTASSTKTDVLCFGTSIGEINLTVTGGTAPYTYSWTNGETTKDLTGLSAGTYTVTITDANNCTTTEIVTITQPASTLSASSTQVNVLCFGTSTGEVNLTVSGGTAPYSYSWTNGETTKDLTGLSAGNYTVTVTDANNCTTIENVTITQPASALSASSTLVNVLCFGTSTGEINLTVTGGTAPYTYNWSSGQVVEDLTGLTAGSYTVTVTDANNCTTSETITITQPASILSASSTLVNVLCFGTSTGEINLTVTGGTAPYTYNWSSGQVVEDLTGLSAGTYTVTITDANNCTTTEIVTITQPSSALTASSTQTDVLCFGSSTGEISLTVTGGTGPYTYNWTNGETTEDLTGLSAGSYTVTVTDANNCTTTEIVTITQPASTLSASSTQVNVLCFGTSTGEIELTVTGGTAPYTYSWTNGETTKDLTGLSAGSYIVTVTDANNCTTTETITITQPTLVLSASSTQVNVLCFGSSTGEISLTVTGGTAPYTYSWTNGETTKDLTGLSAGSYTVTVTDANNCTTSETITITQPTLALSASSTQVNVLCFGSSTGEISLTLTGGTAPYSYSWTNGETTEDLTGLAAGSYTVTITDANSCTTTEIVTITQPAAVLSASSTKTDVLCFGSSTGEINLTVTGGTAPYTYSWTNGETTKDLTGLSAGSYTVTVTDANNCTTTEIVTITQPAAVLSASSTKTDVLCFGSSTGEINLTVTGGTAPYTYSWTNGETTKDLTGLSAGSYTVTVTDANNCTTTEIVTITQPASTLSASSTQVNVLCFGSSIGEISLTVTGGTAPYTYSWTNGETTKDLTGLVAGSYTVTITDANNCTTVETVNITQPASALTASLVKTDVLCFGTSTGEINLTVTGGTAPYTYSWTNGETTKDLTNLSAGSYTVTVTDANNCTTTEIVTITQPASTLSASSTQVNVLCFGSSTGEISLTVSGGTAPYSYSWTNGETTKDLTGLSAGSYTVTVTDANNCTTTEIVTITQPSSALTASSTQTDVLCFGSSTGEISLTVTGGTAPYSYSWTNGETTKDLTGLSAGTYTVTVTDANNCTTTETVAITQPAAVLSASYTKTDVLCFGSSTGEISLTVTGGIAPYTYSWTNGETTEDLTGLSAGSYTVTVTDANNCTTTEIVTITQPSSALTASSTQTDILCFGASTGEINLTVAGGTAPYTYSWTNGETTKDLTGLSAGSYTVTITDANNCTTIETVTITQPASTLSASSTQVNVLCFGSSTGEINLTVTGGTAPYTYSWTNGETTKDLTGLSAGSYTVTVTDANNCITAEIVTITQPASTLSASSTQVNVLCFGLSTGEIELMVTGGTAPYSYSWTNGETTKDLTGLSAGTYTVTVTDANNCTTTEIVTITQPALPLSASSTQVNILCFGSSTGEINLTVTGGTAPYRYSWTNGETTKDLTGLAAGSYTVTVTDANNCTATEIVTITQPASAVTASYAKIDVLCFGSSTGEISLTVTGGTAPYTYIWTKGETTEDLTGLSAGSYTVTVTDANNCTTTEIVTITQPASTLSASSTQVNVLCFGSSTGEINLTVSGGTAPYTYIWTNGETTEDLTGLSAGSYTVTVTDASNCTTTEIVTITQPASTLSASSTQVNVLCFGSSTGEVNLTVSGGTAPYRYSWTNGETTEDLTGLSAGTYTVTVTDANNCTTSEAITITQPASALSSSSTQVNLLCFGSSTGEINLTVSGGTAPYSYSWTNSETTEDLTGLSAGTYTVTITDANNCTTTEIVTITQPAAALTASSTKTDVLCFGTSTGAIKLNVSGGTTPYSFAWNNGSIIKDLSGLAAGTYTVVIKDAAGCSVTSSITITQPELLSVSLTPKNTSCTGSKDGNIIALVKGGLAPYSIIWNGNTNLNTANLNNLPAGLYQILVTDASGCTATAKVTLTDNICNPIAVNDQFKMDQNLLLTADVAPNDSDPQNDKLVFTKLSDPQHGKVEFKEDGKFTYLPDNDFSGEVSFMYQICNPSGACHIAKVTINVSSSTIVSLTPELASVREGKKVAITARLSRPFKEDVIITIDYSGKAIREKDYLVLDNYINIKIPKGSVTTTEKVSIAALIDDFQEGDEDIVMKIKTVSNPDVQIGNGAVVIINDLYPAPPPTDAPQDEPGNPDIVVDPLMSPNGDGNGNEFFTIRNIESYPDNEVLIFNRWGNELFYIKAYNNSDKVFKGHANKGLLVNSEAPLADGVYFYIINTYTIEATQRVKKINKGYLILKR